MSRQTDQSVSLFERLTIFALVGVLGGVILWDAASLSGASAYFPRAVGGLTILISLVSAGAALRQTRSRTEEAPLRRGIPALLILAFYIYSASWIGFLSSLIWFVPAMAVLGGEKRLLRITLLTVCFGLAVFLVFGVLFNQPLPPELILGEL